MSQYITDQIDTLSRVDILAQGQEKDLFVGRPFYIDYHRAHILVCDAWKHRVSGIPQGTFLLAFYDGEDDVQEAVLLRALGPTALPTDREVVSAMVEYYKDDLDIAGRAGGTKTGSKLDEFTRYEFSFSGLECRVLGSFYYDSEQAEKSKVEFGADLENFYSANNYKVYKAKGEVLKAIVNQRDGKETAGGEGEFEIGKVRYSSSRRFHRLEVEKDPVRVYVSPKDFMGKRTALFGMTRTGKSNTVKIVIQATVEISRKAKRDLNDDTRYASNGQEKQPSLLDPSLDSKYKHSSEVLNPFDGNVPKYPVGQIIFDVNGEYANGNMQDQGTAIFELYQKDTIRYSVLTKPGFRVMKANFFQEIGTGFELIQSFFREKKETSDYVSNFLAINLEKPENYASDRSAKTRYDRLVAAYLCCLFRAGFEVPKGFTVRFTGNKDLNEKIREGGLDPQGGVSLKDAMIWFTQVWEHSNEWEFFKKYEKQKGHGWIDEDLQACLIFLTRHKVPGKQGTVSGYLKLNTTELKDLHTPDSNRSFEDEIVEYLRLGKIVIIDLSQGSPAVKNLFSEKLCTRIFNDAMARFIQNQPNNFIQFYFEEAHNLFPKKDDKDLSQIYNRIAKEGAKLNLGLTYATQEVSSISSNILKNTQNWFIAHLNNEDELRELKKYYDFADFTDSLVRFSASADKGFVRMKTYTNPFVVPVQIRRFLAEEIK